MRHRIPALCVIALTLVAGCGTTSDGAKSGATATDGTFVLTEFAITLDRTIPAGQITVTIDNQGAEPHELVIVAVDSADMMPRKSDGSVDEEQIPEVDKVGEVEDIAGRTSTTAAFTLEPGTYVAFCNIVDEMGATGDSAAGSSGMPMGSGTDSTVMMGNASGHVHFAQGMYMTFTVK